MKTTKLMILLLLISVWSCNNADEEVTNENDVNNYSKRASNEILEFKDFDEYDATIEMLYDKIESHDDAFLKEYGHLEEDELDDMEDKLNYDDFQPVIEFEKERGFKSLRSIIAEKEEEWLAQQGDVEVLDEKTDPDNHFIVDDVERALLNEFAEVKIGKFYHKFYDWGVVKTENYNSLTRARFFIASINSVPVLIDLGFVIVSTYPTNTGGGTTTTGCKKTLTRENSYVNGHNGRRRIKVKHKVRLNQFAGAPKIVTIIKGYKKRRRKWRKRRTPIGILFNGNCLENCEDELYVSKYKSVRRRRSRRAKITGGDWWNTGAGTLKFGIINQGIQVKATQYSWSITKDLYDNSNW
ncbi:hypothetical protein [Tenacibaculum xiamenense]|uniref:hypothetical protein n=1 Tax=Tenacibaculum xiamenense TaxID=1261553 RepID=UPI0038953ED1